MNNFKNKSTILDYIEHIEVSGEVFINPTNEYWALAFLKYGLFFLYDLIRRYNKIVFDRLDKKKVHTLYINSEYFRNIPMELIYSIHHWYSISAYQYVRTIGRIACNIGIINNKPRKYIESVIPEVLEFRNKVSAHFTWTSSNKKDNIAEEMASVMPNIGFNDDTFFVMPFVISHKSNNKSWDSSNLKPWNIPEIHIRLCKRYWPDFLSSDNKTQG